MRPCLSNFCQLRLLLSLVSFLFDPEPILLFVPPTVYSVDNVLDLENRHDQRHISRYDTPAADLALQPVFLHPFAADLWVTKVLQFGVCWVVTYNVAVERILEVVQSIPDRHCGLSGL